MTGGNTKLMSTSNINRDNPVYIIASFPRPNHKDSHTLYTTVCEYNGDKKTTLVIDGFPSSDPVTTAIKHAPALPDLLRSCLTKGDLLIDVVKQLAYSGNGETGDPDIQLLLEVFVIVSHMPLYEFSASRTDTVSVILAGGKGSRMQSDDTPKVCFPVADVPAILHLIDQLEKAGVNRHIIVIGDKGSKVIDVVSEHHDNVHFIYQIYRTGTGNAAEQAGHFLKENMFNGDVLLVLGDKVVEQSAIERLTGTFHKHNADLALMVSDKGMWPDAGRIVMDEHNHPIDIVEKRDVQKLILSSRIRELASSRTSVNPSEIVDIILSEVPTRSKADKMFPELMKRTDMGTPVVGNELVSLIPDTDLRYLVPVNGGNKSLSGDELEKACAYTNSSVYLFSAAAFYRTVFSLDTDNAQQEQYLTDAIRLLHSDPERDWTVEAVVARSKEEVMGFNTPEELAEIDQYYRTKADTI